MKKYIIARICSSLPYMIIIYCTILFVISIFSITSYIQYTDILDARLSNNGILHGFQKLFLKISLFYTQPLLRPNIKISRNILGLCLHGDGNVTNYRTCLYMCFVNTQVKIDLRNKYLI